MPSPDLDPSDFIDSSPTTPPLELSPAFWIQQHAGMQSKLWEDMNHQDRMNTLIGAVIAYLETKWLEDKKE